MIPAHRLGSSKFSRPLAAHEVASVGEFFYRAAHAFQSLQFGSHVVAAVLIPALIQRNHADFVTPDDVQIFLAVIQGKRKDAAQIFQKINAFVQVQRQNHLAVALGLELIAVGIFGANVLVVVDFAVHRKNYRAVGTDKRLLSRKRVYDGKTFVAQNRVVARVHAAPVRSSVANLARHVQKLRAQFILQALVNRFASRRQIKRTYKSTHIYLSLIA